MSRIKAERAAAIVRDSGGVVVGRTRLQKITYLLSAAGLENDFSFSYRHYGPYSVDLAEASNDAGLLGLLNEKEELAAWGGFYSIFMSHGEIDPELPPGRRELLSIAVGADPVELELAATALYLLREKNDDPWTETQRRKPDKCENGRLNRAKELYDKLREVETPIRLPAIN